MRRLPAYARWAVGIVTLVVVALCAGAALAAAPPPANVYVDAAGLCKGKVPCYTTIQAGVDAAVPGDVVLVHKGTYHEHVVVMKAITLVGDSKSGAVIDGDGTGTVVTLAESGATLSQLAVKHGLVGVNVSGSSGNTLSDLKVSDCDNGAVPPAERLGRGIFFSGSASGNIVQDTEVTGSGLYAIDVGDQLSENNQFLRLKLHKNPGKGFNAYAGSNGLVLKDSSIEKNGNGGVQIGWSSSWTVEHNEIARNVGQGIVTDTVWNALVRHNFIAGNTGAGIWEAGNWSYVTSVDNRIEGNALSGIFFQIGAWNAVQHNMFVGNGGYGVEIMNHPYGNNGNTITGNYVFASLGSLGDALDDAGLNNWSGNYYSGNVPWVTPFPIPGLAGTMDTAPLMQSALPKPATKADCKKDGWWLLTNGTAPFANEGKCVAFTR